MIVGSEKRFQFVGQLEAATRSQLPVSSLARSPLPASVSCRCMDLLFRLLQPRSSRYFFVVASFLALAVVNGSLRHSPGTPQHRSFPQLNSHRARVHRNRQRPPANDFTGRAHNSPPPFTPQGQRASGKVLTLLILVALTRRPDFRSSGKKWPVPGLPGPSRRRKWRRQGADWGRRPLGRYSALHCHEVH